MEVLYSDYFRTPEPVFPNWLFYKSGLTTLLENHFLCFYQSTENRSHVETIFGIKVCFNLEATAQGIIFYTGHCID